MKTQKICEVIYIYIYMQICVEVVQVNFLLF